MSTTPTVRHLLLRDGAAWLGPLPAQMQVGDDERLRLADGQSDAWWTSGPHDAGVASDWERVRVDVDDAAAGVALQTACGNDPQAAPSWRDEPALEVLLDRAAAPAAAAPGTRRWLWLRIRLSRADASAPSPALRQVHAQTLGRSWIEDLPAVYRRSDQPTRLLQRLLALVQGDLERVHEMLAALPALFDPDATAPEHLDWLASLLDFEFPPALDMARRRALLRRLPQWLARRGTAAGLADWIEMHTGQRPTIVEDWMLRQPWALGDGARLGMGTRLADIAPDGSIVPGHTGPDAALAGLLRETHLGPDFRGAAEPMRIDPQLHLSGAAQIDLPPADASQPAPRVWSLRWSGWLRPRAAERSSLSLIVQGADPGDDLRLRLHVDGRPLIDDEWTDSPVAPGGQVMNQNRIQRDLVLNIDERRWLPLRMELRATALRVSLEMGLQSRSQAYRVLGADDLHAGSEPPPAAAASTAALDLGAFVVGASAPQRPQDFGRGLFADDAHRFTVLMPPGCDCGPAAQAHLRRLIDAEKPAHTEVRLCWLKPDLRVGLQGWLGIDTVVGDGAPPGRLDHMQLGRSAALGATPTGNSHDS